MTEPVSQWPCVTNIPPSSITCNKEMSTLPTICRIMTHLFHINKPLYVTKHVTCKHQAIYKGTSPTRTQNKNVKTTCRTHIQISQNSPDIRERVTWRRSTMRSRARSTLRRQHNPSDLTAWLRTAGSVFWMPGNIYHTTRIKCYHHDRPACSRDFVIKHYAACLATDTVTTMTKHFIDLLHWETDQRHYVVQSRCSKSSDDGQRQLEETRG